MPNNILNNEETEDVEIIYPPDFQTLDDFEKWLHDEICERDDIFLGEILGIFSADRRYIDKIIIPFHVRKDDKTGEIIGPEISHNLTEDEKDLIRGNIISHNHPTGSPFSYNEILSASDLGVIESRIVTKEWIYSITPIDRRWPPTDDIQKTNREIDKDHSLDYRVTQWKFDPVGKHLRYEILARRAGFLYTRIEFSS